MDVWFKPAAEVSKFLPAGADLDQDDEEEAEEEGAVTFLTTEGNAYVKKKLYFTRPKMSMLHLGSLFLRLLASMWRGESRLMKSKNKLKFKMEVNFRDVFKVCLAEKLR